MKATIANVQLCEQDICKFVIGPPKKIRSKKWATKYFLTISPSLECGNLKRYIGFSFWQTFRSSFTLRGLKKGTWQSSWGEWRTSCRRGWSRWGQSNQRSLPLAESRETLLKILIVDIWRGLSIYVRSVDQDICFIVASPLLRRKEESVVCINVLYISCKIFRSTGWATLKFCLTETIKTES